MSVYSIPPELLAALQVRSIQARDTEPTEPAEPERAAPDVPAVALSSGLGCQTCPGASFEHPDEQRAHFKSDWHRYNAKARGQAKAVTADEWDNMVEGMCVDEVVADRKVFPVSPDRHRQHHRARPSRASLGC